MRGSGRAVDLLVDDPASTFMPVLSDDPDEEPAAGVREGDPRRPPETEGFTEGGLHDLSGEFDSDAADGQQTDDVDQEGHGEEEHLPATQDRNASFHA